MCLPLLQALVYKVPHISMHGVVTPWASLCRFCRGKWPPGAPPLQKSLPLPEAWVGTHMVSGYSVHDSRHLQGSPAHKQSCTSRWGLTQLQHDLSFQLVLFQGSISALCSHIQTPYHKAFLAKWFPLNLWSCSINRWSAQPARSSQTAASACTSQEWYT